MALIGIVYPSKQPNETWVVEVDFVDLLVPGETITVATATSKRRSDGATTTASFLTGAAQIDGTFVRVRTVAGAAGETHRIQFRITTAAPFANTWDAEVDVPVEDKSR